jgi:hydroxymethylpyrimidine/phosphomethylpyrimidine kinase
VKNSKPRKKQPVILSIAGFDPSSGAGVTADIKTAAQHGCYGVGCITALTVQSSRGVRRVEPVAASVIAETLQELAADMPLAAVKIGMLGSAEAVRAVASFLAANRVRYVVLDPILRSSSGAELLSDEGVLAMKKLLLPLATVLTPNLGEAAALSGLAVSNLDEMRAAAHRLHDMGAKNVIITGGHLDVPMDLLSMRDGKSQRVLKGKRIKSRATHGTGCAFATALACNLAKGRSLSKATVAAKKFVSAALRRGFCLGKGPGSVV